MMRALWTAASGMSAKQTNLDLISNNLANVNTTGFKSSRANFQDMLYQDMAAAGSQTGDDSQAPTGLEIGLGVRTVSTQKLFTTGDFKQTGNPLDLAIQGDGFFEVQTANGLAYTRDGSFTLDANGRIVNANGYAMNGNIRIPTDAVSVTIGPNGAVNVQEAGSQAAKQVGQINLARFINPAGLSNIGQNLYTPTTASGTAQTGTPGSSAFGGIAQDTLEMSNVSVVQEMVNMIVAQRAYETNSKAIQSADDMLQMANQLHR